MIMTEAAFPEGVLCGGCRREILPGEPYKLRDLATGKLSTGPCTEDRGDGLFHAGC